MDNLPHEAVMFRYNVGVYVYASWADGIIWGFGRESVWKEGLVREMTGKDLYIT